MLEELKGIKSGRRELREFGVVIGAILIILGVVSLARGREISPYLLAAGGVSLLLGLTLPVALKPLQKIWMGLGIVLGFFVSRIVLSVLFYMVIAPIGIVMRTLGKDILDERIDKKKGSYWNERAGPEKPKESYENQY
ncbi:MAG: SxtJ family membrane protein [Candidatus Omnitrophota bacterium]|jgi:multisubunit Na+/H+ antiporter MnhG subunit